MPNMPPPPLDDPSIENPLECPPLRWGLIGCGRVCHDFTQALKHLPTATVVACSARDVQRAQEFADKHGIAKAYGSYQELLSDETVDIVYVGNVHSTRRMIVAMVIKAGKHVLVEKPFACTLEDAEYLIQLARTKKVFCLEGMWTRFFPAVEQARRLTIGAEASLGEIVSVSSDFSFNPTDSGDPYPDSFMYDRRSGGGSCMMVGPYPVSTSTMFFHGREPESIKVVGQVDEQTGVDLQACLALLFGATDQVAPVNDPNHPESTAKLPGAGVASITYGMLGESDEITTVVGTRGRLVIETPCHCPTRLTVKVKGEGRGVAAGQVEYDYPFPEDTPAILNAGGYVYPNSTGFCYEAAAVARCIAKGLTEAPQYTLSETLVTMKILDQVRKQLGVKSIYEE